MNFSFLCFLPLLCPSKAFVELDCRTGYAAEHVTYEDNKKRKGKCKYVCSVEA